MYRSNQLSPTILVLLPFMHKYRFADASSPDRHKIMHNSLEDNNCVKAYSMRKHAMQILNALHGQDHILMECTFPGDYPNSPFFLRIISPRMCWYTGTVSSQYNGHPLKQQYECKDKATGFQSLPMTALVLLSNLMLQQLTWD